jgi:hypothetical protein
MACCGQVLQADQQEKEVRQLQKQMVQQWKLERKQQQQQQEQQAVEMYRLQQERERQQLMQRRLALRQQLQSAKALQQQGGAPAVQSPAVCRQAEQVCLLANPLPCLTSCEQGWTCRRAELPDLTCNQAAKSLHWTASHTQSPPPWLLVDNWRQYRIVMGPSAADLHSMGCQQ